MRPARIEIPKDRIAEFCRRRNIRKLALFGSVVRDDFQPGSGEAASRTPTDERTQYPDIPWAQIVGLRNRLIHGYDSVDFDIHSQIVTHDLPPLIAAPEQIVPSDDGA